MQYSICREYISFLFGGSTSCGIVEFTSLGRISAAEYVLRRKLKAKATRQGVCMPLALTSIFLAGTEVYQHLFISSVHSKSVALRQ